VPYFVDHYHELGYPIADGDNQRGLRRAQLGAIHHIAGHFTLEQLPALTVLPTGAGKTTVLLMTAFVQRAHRVLVITPSRLVRGQVAAYFKTLHPLKEIGVVRDDLTVPRTLEVTTKVTAQDDWENLRDYDVVVSTPNCISPALTDVPDPPEDLFDLLLIDEAHHSAYSTEVCHPIRRKAATQSMAKLPPNPQEVCHPIHGKAATESTGKLPPNPRQGCHPWRVPLAPIGAKRRRASTVLL